MKHKRIPVAVGVALVLLCGLVLLPALVSGSGVTDADPLISLSYLNGTFRSQTDAAAAERIEAERKTLETELDGKIAAVKASSQSTADVTTHTRVSIPGGSSYTVPDGAEVLFLSGAATASDAGLTDATAGSAVAAGGALTANHLYLAGGTVTLRAGETSVILIRK